MFRHLLFLSIALVAAAVVNCYEQSEYIDFVSKLSKIPAYREDFENNARKLVAQDPYYLHTMSPSRSNRFNCSSLPPKPNSPARSVHKLTPYDIGIVAALGDSLTAAAGAEATSIVQMTLESRGVSWSIGGDATLETVMTLPNILKKFNPNVVGYSTGKNVALMQHLHKGTNLNMAVSGNEANHMPGQARELVEKLKNLKGVNYLNEWKLVTLFIGGNDGCHSCKNASFYHQDNYVHYIQQALDILHDELPKTYVNLVPVLDVSLVSELTSGLFCSTLHNRFCGCAAYPESATSLRELQLLIKKYQAGVENLVNSGKYDNYDDFTVVVQPFLKDMTIPYTPEGEPDYTFFAPDCFHFSTKAQGEAAVALWNNMFTRVGEKSTEWNIGESIKCPTTKTPYFFTKKN